MPLDPQAKALLDMMKSTGAPPFSALSPAAARKQMNDMRALRGGGRERTEGRRAG